MGVAVGDYVQTRRKINTAVKKGVRGTVVRMAHDQFRVTSYKGPTFWAHEDDLIVLVKGAV